MTAPPSSRAAKIRQRTIVGASLTAAVVAALWLASASTNGLPIAVVATALVVGALIEVLGFRDLRERGIGWTVPGAASAALFLCWDSVRHAAGLRAAGAQAVPASYVSEALFVAVLAGVGGIGLRALERGGLDTRFGRVVLAVLLVLVAYLASAGFYEVAPLARDLGLVLGVAGVAFGVHALSNERPTDVWLAAGVAVWVAVPLPWLWHVWDRFGTSGLVALVALSKVGDVAGYYGGNAFGRHHPFPSLSPGKTVEGCIASAVAAVALGGALGATGLLPGGLARGLLAGLVLNVAAQGGDLLESAVKRRSGVKDSGRLLGPSGGVLDTVDSLLLTVPAAVLSWPWILVPGAAEGGI